MHVEVIGPHVHDGHYDLIGPNGEIILPQVWETMIEPDWSITMHMWPMPEPPKPAPPAPPPGMFDGGPRPRSRHGNHGAHAGHGGRPPPPPPMGHRGGGGGGAPPPPPENWPGPPPHPHPGGRGGPPPGGPPIIVMRPGDAPPKPRRSRTEPATAKGVLGWMAGSKPKSSGKGMFSSYF